MNGSSPLSPAVSVTTKPPAPQNISVSNLSSNAFDLNWDPANQLQNMILILPQTQILITSSNTI